MASDTRYSAPAGHQLISPTVEGIIQKTLAALLRYPRRKLRITALSQRVRHQRSRRFCPRLVIGATSHMP